MAQRSSSSSSVFPAAEGAGSPKGAMAAPLRELGLYSTMLTVATAEGAAAGPALRDASFEAAWRLGDWAWQPPAAWAAAGGADEGRHADADRSHAALYSALREVHPDQCFPRYRFFLVCFGVAGVLDDDRDDPRLILLHARRVLRPLLQVRQPMCQNLLFQVLLFYYYIHLENLVLQSHNHH